MSAVQSESQPRGWFQTALLDFNVPVFKVGGLAILSIHLGSAALQVGSVDKDGKMACGLQVQEHRPCSLMSPRWLTSPNHQRLRTSQRKEETWFLTLRR